MTMRQRVVEVSGKTVEEAVQRALEQLALDRDRVDVEVIREAKGGFLGFGSEDAIVRVTGQPSLLANSPVLQRSVRLRNPYVDPITAVQVALLREWHAARRADVSTGSGASAVSRVGPVLALTINGIAAGLQSTG